MEDLEIPGCTLLVTSAAQPLYGLVREAHESLIAPTFAAGEVEDVELWIERIKTQQQLGLRSGFELALEMSLHQTKRSEKKMKKKTSTRNNSFSTNDSFASGSLSRSGSKQLITSMMSIPRRNSTSHHGSGSGCCTTEDTTPLVFFNQTASSNSQQPTGQHHEMTSIVQVCQQQRRGSAGAVDDAPSGSDDGSSSVSSGDHHGHGGGSRGSGGGKYEHHHSHPHRDAHSHASTTTASSLVHSQHDWEFYLALVVHNESGNIVGVAVHEVYLRAGCGLVSYVVVDPSMRGQGIAQVLMEAAYRNCAVVTRTRGVRSEHEVERDHMATFHALFIEVLNVRDDPLAESDPTNTKCSVVRQKVFKKLGFVPLEMDLVHPGRMKGKRYNLAFRSKVYVPQPKSPKSEDGDRPEEQRQEEKMSNVNGDVTHFPTRNVLLFLEDLFAGILGDEGVHDDNRDYQAYEKQFSGQKTIKAAEEFWR